MIQMLLPEQKAGGVYDFACRLQEHLGADRVQLVHLTEADADAWRPARHVLVHYVGYGFERRGTPLWLLRLLSRRRPAIDRLGVFFHELYADGPPWTSAFWLGPVQQRIVRRLAELSDGWMSTRQRAAAWISERTASRPHAVLPCFSTIGEGALSTEPRRPEVVVFGTPGVRVEAYRRAGAALFAWATAQGLELHDIGPPIDDPEVSALLERHGARRHGRLDVVEIRERLARARFGVVSYPVAFAGKSSILAAYAAHGLCPIVLSDDATAADGLVAGVTFLSAVPRGPVAPHVERAVATRAQAWYAGHSIARHASSIVALCGPQAPPEAREIC